jgi:hypothetical protein
MPPLHHLYQCTVGVALLMKDNIFFMVSLPISFIFKFCSLRSRINDPVETYRISLAVRSGVKHLLSRKALPISATLAKAPSSRGILL